MAKKPKSPKRIFAENMSATFLHIVGGRLMKVLSREVERMIEEIHESRNNVEIHQKKKRKK